MLPFLLPTLQQPTPKRTQITNNTKKTLKKDYRWWWRAYCTSGASALYLFAYSAFYFYSKLDITKLVPMLLYFGYMAVTSYGFFCLTGTIGFYACYWFVRKIYGAIKID